MAQKPTAERVKEAREKLAEARSLRAALVAKLGTPEWSEDTDGQALETAKRNCENLEKTADLLAEELVYETESRSHAPAGSPVSVNILSPQRRGDKWENARTEFRMLRAIDLLSSGKPLDGVEAEMSQEGETEIRSLGLKGATGNLRLPDALVRVPSMTYEQRDMLAETTTAGGHTVQTSVKQLIPILQPKLQVEAMGAIILRGLTDNIDFPRNDADASAVWASEVATSTETSPTFDKVSMSPERLTAFSDVSKQVLRQSSIDMENFVRQRLTFAVRKALDLAAINGSGSSDQPLGILNTSGVNDITIATDGGPLTWALTVQFETETATDNADFGRLGYLTTPGVAGKLKTTEKASSTAQYIWVGNNGDSGQINGYRARVSTQVPSTLSKGASSGILHAMIFGNWEELMIGQWGGIDLLVNPYTKGKEALVEIIVNSWWDVAVRHAASFCICNEINPA